MIIGSEFAWDNNRNGVRLCLPCLEKISDVAESNKERESVAAAAAIVKSDTERIQALEEQVLTLSEQILHLKSLWWNEIRTYTRMSAAATNRRLTPPIANDPPAFGNLSNTVAAYRPKDEEEIPF